MVLQPDTINAGTRTWLITSLIAWFPSTINSNTSPVESTRKVAFINDWVITILNQAQTGPDNACIYTRKTVFFLFFCRLAISVICSSRHHESQKDCRGTEAPWWCCQVVWDRRQCNCLVWRRASSNANQISMLLLLNILKLVRVFVD